MLGVCGAFLNPFLERGFLFRLECAVRVGWRHHFRFVIARDSPPKLTLFRIAGHNGGHTVAVGQRRLGHVKPQIGLTGLFVEAMALEAGFRKDWPDVAVEVELLFRRRWGGAQEASQYREESRT